MTEPLTDACASCARARVVGWLCWPCHHHLADLLSDRPGSDWNPARPDDPYVPPGLGWLIPALHRHTGQRSTKAEQEGGSASSFASRSPADDHILALRDRRTQIVDEFAVLAGGRWMGYSARQLAETDAETIMTARTELRATQRHLLAVLGDGFGARLVGYCRMNAGMAPTPGGMYEAVQCGAPLWCPPQPPHGDDEAGLPPSVRCPACRHVYGGLSLVQMGRVMPEEVAA
jgi:hypothetical protein